MSRVDKCCNREDEKAKQYSLMQLIHLLKVFGTILINAIGLYNYLCTVAIFNPKYLIVMIMKHNCMILSFQKVFVYLVAILFFFPWSLQSQKQIIIDPAIKHQTIYGFGASDAWNADFVGRYWSLSVRNDLAQKLFSQKFNANGTPEGIGLSRWRFNVGAGSAEQGTASNIEMEERRAECFMNADGTYNWNKQLGQQWFLRKAKEHGVEHLVAFLNSPPRFYTLNGRANSNNTNRNGNTNLKADHYDEFAEFMATVLKYFSDEGLAFSQISPVNEPQYEWNSGQEGCPWTNTEIKTLAVELNAAILRKGLDTKMLLAEAASYDYIHKVQGDANKSDQIWKFFNASRPEYLGNLSQMLPGICAHSYWTDDSDSRIIEARANILRESREQGNIELYQTEYNLLSKSFSTKLENTIFLAKMIYADLAIANMSVWDYWTAMERERWSQLNRFYLVRLRPTGGDYGVLTAGGSVTYDKNLWALGNYSLFIRPGYQRIDLSGATDLNSLMATAYLSPDTSRMVLVYVNWGTAAETVQHNFRNLPDGYQIKNIVPYITDNSNNLAPKSAIAQGDVYSIPARSVVTLVVNLESEKTTLNTGKASELKLYPNPAQATIYIESENLRNAKYSITDIQGKMIVEGQLGDESKHSINLIHLPAGSYIFHSGEFSSRFVLE